LDGQLDGQNHVEIAGSCTILTTDLLKAIVGSLKGWMNENEMDRYFWRTGQRWSADYRPHTWRLGPRVLRAFFLLFAAYLVTAAILFLSR
jgi:hypothetical protein